MKKKRTATQTLLLAIAVIAVLLNRAGILQLPQSNNPQPTQAVQAVQMQPTSAPADRKTATPALSENAAKPTSAAKTAAPAQDGKTYWGNPQSLQDHFDRHGADFKAKNPDDYARQAHAFYLQRDQYQVKTDQGGNIRVYDDATGAFAAYNRDGTTKTFFKPDDGQAYFDRQPGK